ncbi:hypothetical protein [Dysosmobacter sp.]|uniref:hypothetical protein n=1 Tax=Dysosmobacter sp. TaxID=2591382 RepID=UPI002A9E17F7|nr:hypothetical protein [Dysosmobacter sp.]MDY5612474.1 hypothetical protein [Dysosmobacter sp.]
MAITRSFFIFTMAISVFHNPSDNKLRSFLQVPAGRFPQGGAFRLRCIPDIIRLLGGPFFGLFQQLPATLRRVRTCFFKQCNTFTLSIRSYLARFRLRGSFPLPHLRLQ